MKDIIYISDFLANHADLFDQLKTSVDWDDRMRARKTASYGVAYNYSQINYPDQGFTEELEEVVEKINEALGFEPNNCLINYYLDGQSKMGFHSDQTDILVPDTGVVIVSLGETRTLRFRKIEDHSVVVDYDLPSGSLIYMTNEVQDEWQHAIPKSITDKGRMSLTFRQIRV